VDLVINEFKIKNIQYFHQEVGSHLWD